MIFSRRTSGSVEESVWVSLSRSRMERASSMSPSRSGLKVIVTVAMSPVVTRIYKDRKYYLYRSPPGSAAWCEQPSWRDRKDRLGADPIPLEDGIGGQD